MTRLLIPVYVLIALAALTAQLVLVGVALAVRGATVVYESG